MDEPDLETTVNAPLPLPTWEAQAELPLNLKGKHRDYEHQEFTPVGLILKKGERIAFSYGCLENHPNHIEEYQRRGITVLNHFAGISHRALLEAESIYRLSGNLAEVNGYLTLSLQEQEKIKNRSRKH
ncbi:hypothetical protein HZC30_02740 [Candidatus Woesearchaeota archaeon]|nr:hypothetical protein [Candidatus Woesearchaeota archaeon]